MAANNFSLLILIFHPILVLLPVIIPPLDFEECAKLPLSLVWSFRFGDGGEQERKKYMAGGRSSITLLSGV